jgi:hypothetical protein
LPYPINHQARIAKYEVIYPGIHIDDNKSFPYPTNVLRMEFGWELTYALSTLSPLNLATGRLNADKPIGNDNFAAKSKNGRKNVSRSEDEGL